MGRAPLIVTKMKTALAFALVTLVVTAAPAAHAARPRDPSLEAPARPPLTVSLGSGREATGQPVSAEGSPWALPAQVFVDAPVVTSAE